MSSDRAPDVVGVDEIAQLLNVNRSRVYQLRVRPDFPAGRELACGTVYDRRAIIAWNLTRKRRRPMLRALQVYRETGTVAAAARAVDRDPGTIRGWLRELEEPLPRDSSRDPASAPRYRVDPHEFTDSIRYDIIDTHRGGHHIAASAYAPRPR